MRFHLAVFGVLIAGLAAAEPASTMNVNARANSSGPRKRAIPVHVSSRRPGAAAVGNTRSAARSTSKSGTGAAARQVANIPRPGSPGADRYREIQDSLISKGYLQGSSTGVWDQSSIDAMRKFQSDQKMAPNGKITSKALISLGLGPKDESAPPPIK
jgi:hypothetical protein